MTAELTIRADGTVEMAYLEGVARWHGLGNELLAGATIEQWIAAAGMDWRILRAYARYAISAEDSNNPDSYRICDDTIILLRSDTKDKLGVVSPMYKPVQPREMLEFWRDLTETGGMQLQTAGTLFGGRKLWAMAKVGEASIIDPANKVQANLLLSTACDGSQATEAHYCSTVVVCNNTLRMAASEATGKVKVNHKTRFDAKAVQRDLGIESAITTFDRTIAEMRRLAETRMREVDVVLSTARLLHPDYDSVDDAAKAKIERSKPVEAISRLALDGTAIGSDLDGMNGTAWGWLNSVTEYVDHGARAKSADTRMDSAFFGRGAELKERAYTMAVEYQPSLSEVISATNAMFDDRKAASSTGSSLLDSVIAETIM